MPTQLFSRFHIIFPCFLLNFSKLHDISRFSRCTLIFPGVPSFFQVFKVEWEPSIILLSGSWKYFNMWHAFHKSLTAGAVSAITTFWEKVRRQMKMKNPLIYQCFNISPISFMNIKPKTVFVVKTVNRDFIFLLNHCVCWGIVYSLHPVISPLRK